MRILFSIIAFILLPNSVYSQQNKIGLTCTAPNEIPMIFNVDLSKESAAYFDFAKNDWRNFKFVTVRLNELVLMPDMLQGIQKSDRLIYSKGYAKIHIDRTSLEWFTMLTIDFDSNYIGRTGGCSVHEVNEINDIARREYDRLNNTRAF